MGASPGCSCILLKSTVRASIRGGVPVFKRSTLKGNSRKRSASAIEGGSPARPPLKFSKPICIWPPKKVPTVNTTLGALKRNPIWVTTPTTLSFSTIRSSHDC